MSKIKRIQNHQQVSESYTGKTNKILKMKNLWKIIIKFKNKEQLKKGTNI